MMPDAAAAEVVRLQQALVANRNELKGAYQQARRQQKRVQCCGLGPAARRTTLAVYVLSNYNIALAVRVACRLSTYKRPEDAGFPTAAALEELFLESPPTDWLEFGELAAQRAHAFVAEAATSDWVRDCNVLHGVAPSSMDVFLHWEHAFIGHQLDVGVPPRRYVNKWAQKWRARWECPPQSVETGGAQGPGSFKSESPLDGRKLLQYFGPLFGSRFRTQKRVRVRCRILFACTGFALRAPFLVPVFGFVLSPSIAAPFWMRRCCFHTACFVLQGQCFLAASALSIPEVCRPRHSHVEC